MQTSPSSLQLPANATPGEYWDLSHVLNLVGDNLVRVDAQNRVRPALAISWKSDPGARRWEITLRHGVKFQDGTVLTPAVAAQILGPAHPDWTMNGSGDILTIQSEVPVPSLLAELALPRNLILKHLANGVPVGTGPYRVVEFQPGRFLKLAAGEDCWSGRAFADTIGIEFGKSLREQATALELGRTDVVELSPISNLVNRSGGTSLPVELVALVFPTTSRPQDARLREALALAIDRKPIQSVLLKGAGEPTGSLLPNWMTGYSALFPTRVDLQRARSLLADFHQPSLTLSYDPRDPQAQLIAERIALNARDAGIFVQVSLSGTADINLVRIVLPSPDPATALREAARQLGLAQPAIGGNAVEDLYQAEHAMLEGNTVVPLFHLPVAAAASARVQNWKPDRLGNWDVPDVSLEANSQ